MATQAQLEQWKDEHRRADEIYEEQADALYLYIKELQKYEQELNEYAQELNEFLGQLQKLEGLKEPEKVNFFTTTALARTEPKFLPLLYPELVELFGGKVLPFSSPITQLDLFGVSEEKYVYGHSFLTTPAKNGIGSIITSSHNPYSVLEEDVNRFIIDTQSPLYQKILKKADEFTKNYLNGKFFDNFSDDEKLNFFYHLTRNICDSLAKEGIIHKRTNGEKIKSLEYPVFFTEENGQEHFVCGHYATLRDALVTDLIEKYNLPIKAFSFFNYLIFNSGTYHQSNIITDLEGNILAVMEQDFAAKPSNTS